jgi:hypothetical protein
MKVQAVTTPVYFTGEMVVSIPQVWLCPKIIVLSDLPRYV